jgi:8-oxo-dGTP pyrophosphatase MutT (NUDIX family)
MTTLWHIERALRLTNFNALEAQMRMSPIPRGRRAEEAPRKAGVLLLLYPHVGGSLHLLLTRRTETLQKHSGQVSFPGGRCEEGDPDFTATAIRETREELGLQGDINVLGQLTQIYVPPSNYDVYPSVGYVPTLPPLNPNPHEVAEVLSLPLDDLLNPALKGEEMRQIQGYNVRIRYYLANGHKVWGATAIMLSELELRLRAVLG